MERASVLEVLQLKQFHDACCNDAKTEADLIAAGKLAADVM